MFSLEIKMLLATLRFLLRSGDKRHQHMLCFLCVYLITNSLELSPSWEASSPSDTQELPNFYGIRRNKISSYRNSENRTKYQSTADPTQYADLSEQTIAILKINKFCDDTSPPTFRRNIVS
jgi:hypothetical protein